MLVRTNHYHLLIIVNVLGNSGEFTCLGHVGELSDYAAARGTLIALERADTNWTDSTKAVWG